jgi:uncharacterized protein DUF3857/transglutaminase superfamily protein
MLPLGIGLRISLLSSLLLTGTCARAYADWQQPNSQELSMAAEPLAPNAAAILLYREETSDDKIHMHSVYVRLKVLTEQGKHYADVQIPYEQRRFSITDVAGRTIHSDGTVIPFAGKPYDKMLLKTATLQYQAKIFSMPDVQVGSILEYRYKLRYEDDRVVPPTWYIQSGLYLRKGHYRFVPSDRAMTSGRDQLVNSLIWTPILPKGVEVRPVHGTYELDVENIPAEPKEEYLPPIHSLTYRVYFLYSPYRTAAEYWKNEGKYWSKQADKFIGPDDRVRTAVGQLTAPSDSQEQKLRKLYAAVMGMENTDFTRQRSTAEDKSEGLHSVKTAGDILQRKHGSGDEMAMLFVSMARAAGMKAYLMGVTNRDREMFNANLLSMDQLDDDVAIVNVNGKEQFFDPGQRFCTYGQMHWKHTMAGGVRQTDDGTGFAITPADPYTDSKTVRVASLTMDQQGNVTGTVRIGYTGVPALNWRQAAIETDQAEAEKQMEDSLRKMLPGGLTVKLENTFYLDDPSKQLVANFHVEGPLGNATSKRLFVPVEIFEAAVKPMFTQAKRETPVYFRYAYENLDQVSVTYPASMTVESLPKQDDVSLPQLAVMQMNSQNKGNTLIVMRSFAIATVIFKRDEYDKLRSFYSKVNSKDQEQAVLTVSARATSN